MQNECCSEFVDAGDPGSAIFLAGSARSGTTWVSEILNYDHEYRYMFEPFSPEETPICSGFRERQYIRPEDSNPYFLSTAGTILAGKIRSYWIDNYNRSSCSQRRLIKDIRANLFLKWIHTHFLWPRVDDHLSPVARRRNASLSSR